MLTLLTINCHIWERSWDEIMSSFWLTFTHYKMTLHNNKFSDKRRNLDISTTWLLQILSGKPLNLDINEIN
jgi:hypothetical protein